MSLIDVTYLDVLHELCLQRGLALLLTADQAPSRFASSRTGTVLVNLDVVHPCPGTKFDTRPRRERVRRGELIVRAPLEAVDHDLDAAAELLVQVLTRAPAKAA